MALSDLEKYQAQVGRHQGAEYFYFKAAAGGAFAFFEEVDVAAEQVMLGLLSQQTVNSTVSQTNSWTSVSLFTELSNFSGYGIVPYIAATTASLMSMKLPVARKGAILRLDFTSCLGDANISLFAGTGGAAGVTSASCETMAGVNISCFNISAIGMLTLVGKSAGVWSVLDANDSVTVQPLA